MRLEQSALAVLVPEAEPLVSHFRLRHDPVASRGMPAHVTVLYPFRDPDSIDADTLRGLRDLFGAMDAFDVVLSESSRFPGVLWLRPEPREPFDYMTRAARDRFPDCPPYGGAIDEPVPHLTVADRSRADPAELAGIEPEFAPALAALGPVCARVREAWLMTTTDGRWGKREPLALRALSGR